MNCQEFGTRVDELATLPMSQANSPDTLLAHADTCPACYRRLEAERALSVGLEALADDERKIEAPSFLRNDLMAAFEIRGNTNEATILQFPRASSWARWSWAAAAVILLGFVLFASSWMRSPVTNHTASNATPTVERVQGVVGTNGTSTPPASSIETSEVPSKDLSASKSTREKAARNRVGMASRRKEVSTDSTGLATQGATTEVKSEFVALTYMNTATAMESGIVVRVEVAREQLAALGLPLDLERADEMIKADIVLGDDGVARAIRLVQ